MIPPYPGVSFWKVEVEEQTQHLAILHCRRFDTNRLPETSGVMVVGIEGTTYKNDHESVWTVFHNLTVYSVAFTFRIPAGTVYRTRRFLKKLYETQRGKLPLQDSEFR
jgi:hypothetical protein